MLGLHHQAASSYTESRYSRAGTTESWIYYGTSKEEGAKYKTMGLAVLLHKGIGVMITQLSDYK